MAGNNVVDYIKMTRDMGFSDEKIREVLLRAGHEEPSLDSAFREASPGYSPLQIFGDRKVMLSLIIIASIFSFGMLVQVFFKATEIAGQSMGTIAGYVVYEPGEREVSALAVPDTNNFELHRTDCKSLAGDDRDWCIYSAAKTDNNQQACLDISSPMVRDFCIGALNREISCDKLADSFMKEECIKLAAQ